jgi:hypothetical protein
VATLTQLAIFAIVEKNHVIMITGDRAGFDVTGLLLMPVRHVFFNPVCVT